MHTPVTVYWFSEAHVTKLGQSGSLRILEIRQKQDFLKFVRLYNLGTADDLLCFDYEEKSTGKNRKGDWEGTCREEQRDIKDPRRVGSYTSDYS